MPQMTPDRRSPSATRESDTVAVTIDGVSKAYSATKAVQDLSFAISAGEMFGLIGPDGAGKTTLIRMTCGLLKPDAGRIRVFGRDPLKAHRAVTGTVGTATPLDLPDQCLSSAQCPSRCGAPGWPP